METSHSECETVKTIAAVILVIGVILGTYVAIKIVFWDNIVAIINAYRADEPAGHIWKSIFVMFLQWLFIWVGPVLGAIPGFIMVRLIHKFRPSC